MALHDDLGKLAEVGSTGLPAAVRDREVLAVIAARVGFDVAMFKRRSGLGPHAPGLDPKVRAACEPHFHAFGQEMTEVAQAATEQGGVAVDVDVLGLRRMERLSYYQRLMRPHGGRSTAMVYFTRAGQLLGALALGRTTGSFRPRELAYLRALAPTLSLCEAAASVDVAEPAAELVGLTAREREILGYLPLGYTNAQIARALGSAERTVRNQLSSVYEKLGVASRAEAAALAVERGVSASALAR